MQVISLAAHRHARRKARSSRPLPRTFVSRFENAVISLAAVRDELAERTPEQAARALVARHGVDRAFELAELHMAEAQGDEAAFWQAAAGYIG
jgi:hypothetical protein